jgi:N6-adenosine-specific RNA methylase IME4
MLPLASIETNDADRIRKHYDQRALEELRDSILAIGLLKPISVSSKQASRPGAYRLIDGRRRIMVWQNWWPDENIPAIVLDISDIDALIAAEFDANEVRENFKPSERAEFWIKHRAKFEAAAKERQRLHGGTAAGRAAPHDPHKGRAMDHVARRFNVSRTTLRKEIAVMEAAQQDPAKYGNLIADMNRHGADGVYKRLKNMQAAERLRAEPPGLPMCGPYRVIAADPPWMADLSSMSDPGARGYYPYPTMSLDEICAMGVQDIAHPDGCALWLWVNNFRLANGDHVKVLDAWGFSPSSTILTWVKTGIGQGQRLRGASEHCVLAVRGDIPPNAGADKTWFEAPTTEHSVKPRKFYEIVERVTPAPRYAMLFAGRELPPNWDGHGDRIGALVTAEMTQ